MVPHVSHDAVRCDNNFWYSPAGQAGHVRSAFGEYTYSVPAPHVGCLVHDRRCESDVWYSSAGQGRQVRSAVLESTNFAPAPHVGCVVHDKRCESDA
jgi:hypothetical protein